MSESAKSAALPKVRIATTSLAGCTRRFSTSTSAYSNWRRSPNSTGRRSPTSNIAALAISH